jgi:hypothetical protein
MTDLAAALDQLDPPPTSANDAARRLGGNRAAVLRAYRRYRASTKPPRPVDQRHDDTTQRPTGPAWLDDDRGWHGIR